MNGVAAEYGRRKPKQKEKGLQAEAGMLRTEGSLSAIEQRPNTWRSGTPKAGFYDEVIAAHT
jgi:hypothetical protein